MTTPQRPLRRDAARNREQLLEAATQVFADEGLGASVEEIARVAGVGMGTLYRRFPTKEDLVLALVQALLAQVVALIELASSKPDGDGLEFFLREVATLQATNRGCLPRLWSSGTHPELVALARQGIASLLVQAQLHRKVRPEITGTDMTVILWSLRGVIESAEARALTVWERHLEIIIAGLRPAPEPLASPALLRSELDALLFSS